MTPGSGINKVFLLGNIATDPWCTHHGKTFKEYTFLLVTTELIEKKDGPCKQQEYHHIKLPERMVPLNGALGRGSLVHIEGKIQTINWVDEEKVKRFKTEIIVSRINLLDHINNPDNGEEKILGQERKWSVSS